MNNNNIDKPLYNIGDYVILKYEWDTHYNKLTKIIDIKFVDHDDSSLGKFNYFVENTTDEYCISYLESYTPNPAPEYLKNE